MLHILLAPGPCRAICDLLGLGHRAAVGLACTAAHASVSEQRRRRSCSLPPDDAESGPLDLFVVGTVEGKPRSHRLLLSRRCPRGGRRPARWGRLLALLLQRTLAAPGGLWVDVSGPIRRVLRFAGGWSCTAAYTELTMGGASSTASSSSSRSRRHA